MPVVIRHMVQAYDRDEAGNLLAQEPFRFQCPDEAVAKLKQLAPRRAGVIAYSWIGDMKTGESGKISLLSRVGDLPKYAAIALGIEECVA